MTNINSYVSKGFFDEFIESKPQNMLSDEFKYWLNLYRFFDKRSTTLKLGATKENLGRKLKNDALIFNLMNDYIGGESNIFFENWDEDKVKMKDEITKHPFQFFFTSSQENIDDTIIKGGFPVYNSSNGLISSSKFFNLEILPVSQKEATNTLKNWKELTKKLLPFHTLTIVDNYLFSSVGAIRNNTIPLIKSIAESVQIDTCFHLSLFFWDLEKEKKDGKTVKDENNKDKEKRTISDIRTEIRKELLSIFKDSNKFKLSIVRLNKSNDFHDRVIFTNSQFMTSGNSFSSYFNESSGVYLNSPTILTIFPLIGETQTPIGETQKGIWGEIAFEILAYLHSLLESTNKPTIVGEPLENNKLLKQFTK